MVDMTLWVKCAL